MAPVPMTFARVRRTSLSSRKSVIMSLEIDVELENAKHRLARHEKYLDSRQSFLAMCGEPWELPQDLGDIQEV